MARARLKLPEAGAAALRVEITLEEASRAGADAVEAARRERLPVVDAAVRAKLRVLDDALAAARDPNDDDLLDACEAANAISGGGALHGAWRRERGVTHDVLARVGGLAERRVGLAFRRSWLRAQGWL